MAKKPRVVSSQRTIYLPKKSYDNGLKIVCDSSGYRSTEYLAPDVGSVRVVYDLGMGEMEFTLDRCE